MTSTEPETRVVTAAGVADTSVQQIAFLARLARGFSSLRIRNYRLYSISQVISLTGTWMQTTAQAWLVLQLTDSPFALGLVTTLQFLPVTLLALYGGVLADRLPKRRTLVVTQTAALIQATVFGLLVATGTIQLWHLYVLAVIQGMITAVDNPVRQAFVVELVGRDSVINAVALNSIVFNAARIVGPAVAGLLIAGLGVAPALFLNALSFVPVIWTLLILDQRALFPASPAVAGSVRRQLMEGLAYSWRTPNVLFVLIVIAFIGTFGYNFGVVLPLLADYVLKTDAAGFGALSSFLGFGSLIAAVSVAYVRNVTARRLIIGSTAFSILLGAVALSPVFALSAALLVALGFSGIIFSTTSNTLLQLSVPDELRGRVMSLNVLLFLGSTPVGGFLIGTLSRLIGVPTTLFSCAVLCLLGVIVAEFYRRATVQEQNCSHSPSPGGERASG
jgi:MFS family permease